MINRNVLRIMMARGSGDRTLKKINEYIKKNTLYSLDDICNSVTLMCSLGINQDVAKNIYENYENVLWLEDKLLEQNVDMCWIGDECFPEGIRKLSIGSIPAVLFYKGNFKLLQGKCVGFTGSRQVSDVGIRITDISARQLSSNGIWVISGYAKGVDITAHKAALQTGGSTVFVIVEGILRNRVKGEIKELLNDKNHLFVSQFMPNITWSASNAMKRNNTIIGLSDAMILIEAGMTGGTFNAGEQSLKNKKPLFVVEYREKKSTSKGNDFFLQHGGMPLRGDENGNPVLRKVYSALEQGNKRNRSYEQLSFDFL